MSRGVTMLSELPELGDVEQAGGYGMNQGMGVERSGFENNTSKFIRSSHTPLDFNNISSPEMMRAGYGQAMGASQHATLGYEEPPMPQGGQVMQQMPPMIHCIDLWSHVTSCPICSKFYKNDTTPYVVTIVVLAIVCLLLLKRVLNV